MNADDLTAALFHRPLRAAWLVDEQGVGSNSDNGDGTEVAAEITSDWMLHSVPIVFVTSLITPEEARDARRINGHRISAKPHTAAELLRVVEESLPRCAEA